VTNILDLKETNAFNNLFLRKKPKLCDYGREQDIMFYFFQKKTIVNLYLLLTTDDGFQELCTQDKN